MGKRAKPTSELDFEEAIEAWLVDHGGYTKADSRLFDAALGLYPQTLLAFLKESQPKTWQRLAVSYGASVEEQVIRRIASECDARGLLDVLRNGVRLRGQTLRLAYFRPPTSLNAETERPYAQNRLTVMRQVYYELDSRKTIDMLLALNGLPVASVELKNTFTGQRSSHAIQQYIKKRVPSIKTPLLQYKKRALVHFAVDTDDVYMTTRLAGDETFFLPFNRGNQGGKGNPLGHDYKTGYKTGYLWEEVWQHDTYQHGVGKNYLIQHSAGSGKTNSISWLAHQLASLHGADNKPLFNSVIVVSDRRNLDKQLQDNIYQIEHKQGVVAKIDEEKHASDLAQELNAGTKIIVTTLQKFSFLMGQVKDLSARTLAVIVDEVQSSERGRSAGNLRGVLGSSVSRQRLDEAAQLAAAEEAARSQAPTLEDLIVAEAKKRGPQSNLSFYAS
jgi:type I restriction enzyme R subunit